MEVRKFLYRQKQKWKYHTSPNYFQKRVAEINRNQPVISVDKDTFKVEGSDLVFHKTDHAFIVDQWDLFLVLLSGAGNFFIEGNELFYTLDDLKLNVTTAEELFIIHEVFIEGCYSLSTTFTYHVIDIGMNVGFASLFFARQPEVRSVYAYEPFAPTFTQAQRNLALNPNIRNKIEAFSFGLGDKNEALLVNYDYDNKSQVGVLGTSLIKGEIKKAESTNISLQKASAVINEITSRHAKEHFLLKIDCEGAEYGIVRDLNENQLLPLFKAIIIEWHEQGPEVLLEILKQNNFVAFHQQASGKKVGMIYATR